MFNRISQKLNRIQPQQIVNTTLVLIGLAADLISLGLFFGLFNAPIEGSNLYVNKREFLAWVLISIIYSVGFLNAVIRRRWRRLYGTEGTDHSIWHLAYFIDLTQGEEGQRKLRIFKRDFSFIYVVMFPITFLYARAVAASVTGTGVTSSPWGDVAFSALIAIPVAYAMMLITSAFDFALSMFRGDQ